MSLFISTAHAAGEAAQQPSLIANLGMIAVFVAIFYFLIWRPQSKRAKEHRALVESLGVGSEVVFAGGLMGKVLKLENVRQMQTILPLHQAVFDPGVG